MAGNSPGANQGARLDMGTARKGILAALLIGIGTLVAIIAVTFRPRTVRALLAIDVTFLGLALTAVLVSWLFSALAFYVLARLVERPISFSASARVYLGGSFFGFVTPFGSGLIPTQVYILTREGLTTGEATAVTSARATISSWLFAALGLIIYFGFREALPGSASIGFLIGIIILATVWSLIVLWFIARPHSAKRGVGRVLASRLLANRIAGDRLDRARDWIYREIDFLSSNLKGVFSLRNAPAVLAVFLIEVVAWFALFAVLPLILFGFGVMGNVAELVFRLFLLFSLAPVSPTPGGSGVIELAFTGLLLGLVPGAIIGLVVLVWRFLTYYLMLIVGGFVIVRFLARAAAAKRKRTPSPQAP